MSLLTEPEKYDGPANSLTFLGIDSVAQEIRLPHEKLVMRKELYSHEEREEGMQEKQTSLPDRSPFTFTCMQGSESREVFSAEAYRQEA